MVRQNYVAIQNEVLAASPLDSQARYSHTLGLLQSLWVPARTARPAQQQVILEVGIKWVSTQFQRAEHGNDQSWIDMIPNQQPVYYPTGLLEITFCGHQDRSYFDVDMGGSPRPLDEWIAYLKGCVDLAYENNLWLSLTTHPSTSFKHDPQARYLREIFDYCRQKPGIIICNYQDLYRWIAAEEGRT